MLIPCAKCGKRLTVETKGSEPYPALTCECGTTINVVESLMGISGRVFCRAEVELLGEDFSLAIVLSAMSVECRLAFLYSKWKALDAGLIESEVTEAHTDAWEKEFQDWKGGVGGKLDKVTRLLTGETFDSFLARRGDLAALLQQAHSIMPTTPAREFFVTELFRKRNKILHSGQVQFGRFEAEACVKMARSLLQVIGEIDKERYTRFDREQHGA